MKVFIFYTYVYTFHSLCIELYVARIQIIFFKMNFNTNFTNFCRLGGDQDLPERNVNNRVCCRQTNCCHLNSLDVCLLHCSSVSSGRSLPTF